MGNHFMMGCSFNKRIPSDFGLIQVNDEYAISPIDGSKWLPRLLYDFGWGNEYGYYRVPLPDYEELIRIAMESQDQDDMFGAAAIILERYPSELLDFCEKTLSAPVHQKQAKRLVKVFRIDQCINRNPVQGKTFDEIARDFYRWKEVSQKAKRFT